MPDFYLIFSGRKIRYRKLPVLISHGIVRIVHDNDVTLHPSVDSAFNIDSACLLEFLLVDLALNRLGDVEEAVVAFKKLDVMQYRITVLQRDLSVHRHDLDMGRILTLVLIDFRILSSRGHCLTTLHAFDDDNRIPHGAGLVDDEFLRFPLGRAAHLRVLSDFPGRQLRHRTGNGNRSCDGPSIRHFCDFVSAGRIRRGPRRGRRNIPPGLFACSTTAAGGHRQHKEDTIN